VSPSSWRLTAEGRAAARVLADTPFRVELLAVAAGDEPKMVASVEPLASAAGLPVQASAEFRESHAEGWFDDQGFRDVVAAFFERPRVAPSPSWEPADDAARRFTAGLERLLGDHRAAGTVAVCSGGRVLTAALGAMSLVPREALLETWRQIRMPDAAVIEFTASGTPDLVRSFGDHPAL